MYGRGYLIGYLGKGEHEMVYKLLEAVLSYIEDLEKRHQLKTITDLKEGIKQEISVMEMEENKSLIIEQVLSYIEDLEKRYELRTVADLKEAIKQGISGEGKRLVFCVNMRHSPDSCPLFNDETMKRFGASLGKRGAIAKKYGVKVLHSCHSVVDHLMLYTVEALSMQAVEDYLTETGFALWNDIKIRQVRVEEECQPK